MSFKLLFWNLLNFVCPKIYLLTVQRSTKGNEKDDGVFESAFTALFTNMRILKFKSQLTIAFFAAVNHLNGPLGKRNFTLTGSKGQGL